VSYLGHDEGDIRNLRMISGIRGDVQREIRAKQEFWPDYKNIYDPMHTG
jgi:hypothetical protein